MRAQKDLGEVHDYEFFVKGDAWDMQSDIDSPSSESFRPAIMILAAGIAFAGRLVEQEIDIDASAFNGTDKGFEKLGPQGGGGVRVRLA